MGKFFIGLCIALVPWSAYAGIIFKDGWDLPENSNVRSYTQEGATDFLEKESEGLKKMIDKPACMLEVTKGCHQPDTPHFTANGTKSKSNCKVDPYAGSKSIHIPC
ncbi:hypothetical protein [Nitrosococcus oceani]|uniref:hypothetical protein n=1 Tax=Nitrosococcus oceani TaxID=1229 RepID=UPI0004E93120|nr:hypothetical protein [Nitrosococcus oceani]KFI21243.1 hypothetical protein HW44_16105 [Nitrosococcus oceani]